MSRSNFYLTMPKERIGALIGKDGNMKKLLEDQAKVALKINSETGEVYVEATNESTAILPVVKNVLRAISCGFSGPSALQLLDEDKHLEIMDLKEIVGKSYKEMERIKGRVIGRDGKVRKNIENYTNSRISVYDTTIAIICKAEDMWIVKRAIDMIIEGLTHNSVYRFIESNKRKAKEDLSLWERK